VSGFTLSRLEAGGEAFEERDASTESGAVGVVAVVCHKIFIDLSEVLYNTLNRYGT